MLVRSEPGLRARCPRGALECVILNLVANAAAAVGPLGSVRVVARRVRGRVEIEVVDDRPGINRTVVEAAFSRQPDRRDIEGLGLRLVRDNLARLGAALRISSAPNRTSFVLEIDPGE